MGWRQIHEVPTCCRTSPNLVDMTTTKISGSEKSAVARGWTESGLTMSSYARLHGISERTLRNWRAIYAAASPVSEARRTVEKAVGQLQALLDGMPPDPEPDAYLPTHAPTGDQRQSGTASIPPAVVTPPVVGPNVQMEATPLPPPVPARATFSWD